MREEWNQYWLSDQTILRMRLIVHDIYRVIDQYTPAGDPIYVVKSSTIVSPDVSDSLKRKEGG